jgi:outer membrane receptor protein involved in Fe transport
MRAILFLTVLIVSLFAGDGRLAGHISDAVSGEPLIGASVSIEKTELGASSDQDGDFLISSLPPGSYNISVHYLGYKTVLKSNIVVKPGKTTYLNVEMREETLKAKGIEVVADYFNIPKEAPLSSISMDFEEIRREPGANQDIQRIVLALPAVAMTSDQMNEIITRGGNPGENLFLMDNIEIPNPNHFGVQGTSGGAINIINILMIDNVDFYAGAFSAKYGDKASSVMNIALREGSREAFHLSLDMGMGGAGLLAEGPIGAGSYLFSARKSFLDLIIKKTGLTAVPQYYNFQGKIAYNLSPGQKLIINGMFGDDRIHIRDSDESDGVDRGAENVKSKNRQYTAGAELRTVWNSNLASFLTVSTVSNRYGAYVYRTKSGAEYFHNYSDEKEHTLKIDFSARAGHDFNADFGAGLKYVNSEYDIWSDADTTYLYLPDNPENPAGIINIRPAYTDNSKIQGYKAFAYFQGNWAGTSGIELSAGVRYLYFSVNQYHALSPRLSLSYHIGGGAKISAAYGRHFQSPQYLFLSANPVNKNLKNYYDDQLVFGVEKIFGNDVRATAELYYKRYRDIPVPLKDLSGDPFIYAAGKMVNSGESRSYGIELFIQKKLTKNFSGIISYSLSRSRTKDLRNGSWYDGDYDYRNIFNLIAGYKYEMQHLGWYREMKEELWYQVLAFFLPFGDEVEWSAKFRYMGGRPYTEPVYHPEWKKWYNDPEAAYNTRRYPDYYRFDIRLDRRFFFGSWSLVTYIDVTNLLGTDNVWTYQYSEDGSVKTVLQYQTFPVGGITLEF